MIRHIVDTLKKMKSITLTPEEKTSLWNKVETQIATVPIPSPLSPELFTTPLVVRKEDVSRHIYRGGARTLKERYVGKKKTLAGALIVSMVLSGTTSLVFAHNALPGDTLYPVKIHVNENLESALTLGLKNKAEVEAKLAVRRLEEAKELALQNRLSEEEKQVIEDRFQTHSQKLETHLKALADTGNNEIVVAIGDTYESDVLTNQMALVQILTEAQATPSVALATHDASELVSVRNSTTVAAPLESKTVSVFRSTPNVFTETILRVASSTVVVRNEARQKLHHTITGRKTSTTTVERTTTVPASTIELFGKASSSTPTAIVLEGQATTTANVEVRESTTTSQPNLPVVIPPQTKLPSSLPNIPGGL
jgi:hypothetical protein